MPKLSAQQLAKRAGEELSYFSTALQQINALFTAIEKAASVGDKNLPFLLAQIGVEMTGFQAERAESEMDFFREESGDV